MFLPILFGSQMWRHKPSYGMLNSLCHNDFIGNIPYIFHKKKLYPKYCIMFGKKRLRKNCGFCGFPPTYNGERKWFIFLVNFVWHCQIIDPHKVCILRPKFLQDEIHFHLWLMRWRSAVLIHRTCWYDYICAGAWVHLVLIWSVDMLELGLAQMLQAPCWMNRSRNCFQVCFFSASCMFWRI